MPSSSACAPRAPAAPRTARLPSRAAASAAASASASASAPPPRILLLGASSELGLATARALRAAGAQVFGLTRSAAPERHAPLLAAGASVLVGDVAEPASLHAAFAAAQPACVLHLAGRSPSSCGGGEAGDTLLAVNAADAAVTHRSVTRLVYLSALGCGESKDCIPAPSEDVLRPWLEAKAAGEEYLRVTAVTHGLSHLVLRCGPLTSAQPATCRLVLSENANAGKAYSSVPRDALAQVLAQAALAGEGALGGRTLAVLDADNVIIAQPYMRGLEPWESLPFDAVPVLA